MADVVKKTTKTLTLKNPSSSSLTKIIKDKLDIDVNNLKGSDIPKLFNKGLKFKGLLGKKVVDSIANYFKKNPNSKKQYEKFLPDSLKKGIKDKKVSKPSVNITPKKIKKIDIANIMKNTRTGRGQKLPVRTTDKNKNTGTNITKRVIEGEVLQGVKPPKGGGVRNTRTIEGQFKRLTPQAIRNQMKNTRTGRGQNKLNIQGLKRKQILGTDKNLPFKTPNAIGDDKTKKIKPPKDFSPKIKKPDSPKVKREDLPKIKSNDYTGRFIDKEGNVAYDSFSDFMAHMTGKPKKRKMPKKTARIFGGTGDKLKRKEADKKGAGKGVKFQAFKSGTRSKTIGLKDLPPKAENPGIHMLPAKAKMNMGFKPMFGGGLIASFYDKPEKTEKYKGNTTSARQVKGYGKAKKKA
jgi:hypothetical protein